MDALANGCTAEGCTDTKMDIDGPTAAQRRTYSWKAPPLALPSCAYSCIGLQPLLAMVAGLLRQLRLKLMHLGSCSVPLLTHLVCMRLLHL